MRLDWKKALLLSACLVTLSAAFTSGNASLRDNSPAIATHLQQASSTTWNLNKSGSPFGFDLNAEVWNGRVAQVSFMWVFIQEWIQGKGMLKGIKDGDAPSMISLNLFVMLILLLGARFAAEPSKGNPLPTVVTPPADTPIIPRKKRVPINQEAFLRSKSLQDLFDPNLPADEKRLNYNGGRSPFGLKKNAEIWNGRVAMLSFAWVFFQELLQGDGMIQGIERLEAAPTIALLMFLAAITGFNGFMGSLADSEDDFVERVVGKEALRANAADPNWKPQYVQPPYKPLSISPSTPLDTSVPTMEAYERQLRLYSPKPIFKDAKPKATYIPGTPPTGQTIPPVVVSARPGTTWGDSYAKSLRAMTAEEPRSTFAANNQQQSFADSLRLMTKSQGSPTLPEKGFEEASAPTMSYSPPPKSTIPSDPTSTIRPGVSISDSIPTPTFSTISMRDATPHPAGQFKFNPSVQSLIMEPRKSKTTSVPDFRVEGYRFKPDTRVAIGTDNNSPHPDGTFTFRSRTSDIIHANDPPRPKPANLALSQIEFPVQGFQFGEATKTLIRATERNTAVPLPKNLDKPDLQPIQSTPDIIEVVSEGTTMNAAPMGSKASATSYLEALSSNKSSTTEAPKSFAPFASAKARPGASYLDSLSRP